MRTDKFTTKFQKAPGDAERARMGKLDTVCGSFIERPYESIKQ